MLFIRVFYKYDFILLVDDIVEIVYILADFLSVVLTIIKIRVLKPPNITVELFTSPLSSVSFCFIYFFSTECTFVIAYVD